MARLGVEITYCNYILIIEARNSTRQHYFKLNPVGAAGGDRVGEPPGAAIGCVEIITSSYQV
jgi:hypothetical protein